MAEPAAISADELEFAEAWRPKIGDALIGVVAGVDARTSDYGEYPIVTVRTAGGSEFAFHAYHTVAKNELAKLRPALGDAIGIKYHGKDAERGYERYVVKVRKPNAAAGGVDWDAMGDDAQAELHQDAPVANGADEEPPF